MSPKGYADGPAAEEAERRREERESGIAPEPQPALRPAVYGATTDDASSHFLGWRDELDPDDLFARGLAWGLTVRRIPVP